MHRNILWIIFLLVLVGCSSWFALQSAFGLAKYFRLHESAPATLTSWKVDEINAERYQLMARFHFTYQDKVYESQSRVGETFPNPWAAENAKDAYAKKNYRAWFNAKKPSEATLKRSLPIKPLLSFAIMLALLIYFLFLGRFAYTKG